MISRTQNKQCLALVMLALSRRFLFVTGCCSSEVFAYFVLSHWCSMGRMCLGWRTRFYCFRCRICSSFRCPCRSCFYASPRGCGVRGMTVQCENPGCHQYPKVRLSSPSDYCTPGVFFGDFRSSCSRRCLWCSIKCIRKNKYIYMYLTSGNYACIYTSFNIKWHINTQFFLYDI